MQLYDKLCQILLNNKLDELGLLDVLPEVTDLPKASQPFYPLIAIDTKLGLGYASLVQLLKEAHVRFVLLDNDDNQDTPALELVTRIMILLKPDNYTAMNRRKKMILHGHIDPKNELDLIQLIFTIPKHAKSPTAWHHRQWLFDNNMIVNDINIDNELELCQRACSIYPKNYYAWTYRSWLVSTRCQQEISILNREYRTSRHWVELNISDYSGVQHLQRVMELLPLVSMDIVDHTHWVEGLIKRYPGHESLWCHKRFCAHLAMRVLGDDGWSPYCEEQHSFIKAVQDGCFVEESLSESDQAMQKELALRFGVWQAFLEKKSGTPIHNNYHHHFLLSSVMNRDKRDLNLK
ncbi:protein prenylyltransferase [Backusella circina FSU 941]|nr:protein prenylyltransferase [Backusella circina FSU 941]